MANRIRYRATGLAAIFGRFSAKQTTGKPTKQSLNVQKIPLKVSHARNHKG